MESFIQGLEFMVIGVSVVFMFLIVMVFAMSLLRITLTQLNKYFHEPEEQKAVPASGDNTQEIAVAIAAAYSMKK